MFGRLLNAHQPDGAESAGEKSLQHDTKSLTPTKTRPGESCPNECLGLLWTFVPLSERPLPVRRSNVNLPTIRF